jgi:hypothetical protein
LPRPIVDPDGTLLMDLEHARVIDLLPDRSARSFAAWLGGQDDVEFLSRDPLWSLR